MSILCVCLCECTALEQQWAYQAKHSSNCTSQDYCLTTCPEGLELCTWSTSGWLQFLLKLHCSYSKNKNIKMCLGWVWVFLLLLRFWFFLFFKQTYAVKDFPNVERLIMEDKTEKKNEKNHI